MQQSARLGLQSLGTPVHVCITCVHVSASAFGLFKLSENEGEMASQPPGQRGGLQPELQRRRAARLRA